MSGPQELAVCVVKLTEAVGTLRREVEFLVGQLSYEQQKAFLEFVKEKK